VYEARVTLKSILVVEPDAVLQHTIAQQLLKPAGYRLFAAQNFDEGLDLTLGTHPDLLILHLRPEVTTAFLEQIKNAKISIPVILAIDKASTQINVNLLKLGVREYVVWPAHSDELLGAVGRALDQRCISRCNVNNSDVSHEFADMASHLLRNPLNVIQTSIRCLQTLDLSQQEQQDLLNKMWGQSQQLTDFTNELLRTLRLESEGAFVCTNPVVLEPLVKRTFDFVRHDKPDLTFLLEAGQNLPPVAGDSTKIEMIVLNLLFGAVRRCQAGGHISVSLTEGTSEILVSIKDNGRPIPVKSLDQVFQSYYPVGQSRSKIPASYQLGLYTTRRLVELHHGRVWAQSHNGQGSEFGFSLPIWRQHND
jgi:signal transduction histidine kinase